MIIGKGGCEIKEIQLKSGAMVHVTKDEDHSAPTRTVTVMGPADEIVAAKALIAAIVERAAQIAYRVSTSQGAGKKLDVGMVEIMHLGQPMHRP